MRFRDWQYLIVLTTLVTISSIVFSEDFVFGGEMMGSSLLVGGIILIIRRGILKVKRKIEEKRQAV